jgi:hypothetical protein
MNEFIKLIKKKMIDAGLENFKELAKAIGMKYDTMLVRLKDPSSFRAYEIRRLAEELGLTDEEILFVVRS